MDYKSLYKLCIIELQLIYGIYKKNKKVFILLENFKQRIKIIKIKEELLLDALKINF
jgi:hypothetical protein